MHASDISFKTQVFIRGLYKVDFEDTYKLISVHNS